jgi:hypothetical protein
MALDDRLKKLARHLEELAKKDEALLQRTEQITALRRAASGELHAICAGFVKSVNGLLSLPVLELGPDEYTPELFRDSGLNLFQINARGRVVQIAFQATDQLVSTEDFKTPYILQGEVRTYNQDMLERVAVEIHQLFFCLEKDRNLWRYYQRRTYRGGVFDEDFLVSVMEDLI